jgi:hypothetical protein
MPCQLKRIFRTAIPALCAVMSVGVAAALPRRLGSQAPNHQAAAGLEIVVTDPSGAVIPNAQVLISSQDGKHIDDGITTAYGVRALELPPGTPHTIILNEPLDLPIFDLYQLDLYRRRQPVLFDVQAAQPGR